MGLLNNLLFAHKQEKLLIKEESLHIDKGLNICTKARAQLNKLSFAR